MIRFACLLLSLFLIACSDSSDDNPPDKALPDFTTADTWLESFVATEPLFPGGSMIIVDKTAGVIIRVRSVIRVRIRWCYWPRPARSQPQRC